MMNNNQVYSRHAISLVEVILTVAILAILIGLLLPAVAKVRESARVLQTNNNERQLILAVHQLSSVQDERIRNLPKNSPQIQPVYSGYSIHRMLVPYVYQDVPYPGPKSTKEEANHYFYPPVKTFIDPSDISLFDAFNESSEGIKTGLINKVSYSANMMVFDGFVSMTGSIPDGHSNTIAFSTHYFHCGTIRINEKWGMLIWDHIPPKPKPTAEDRRATFADAGSRDVVPVREPGTGRTVSSRSGATFEVRPPVADADCRLPQAFYPRGIQVALFDGSVRTIRPTVDETVFWSLVTPNWGEVVTLPD